MLSFLSIPGIPLLQSLDLLGSGLSKMIINLFSSCKEYTLESNNILQWQTSLMESRGGSYE